jgi:hypothetical protein
VSRFPVVRLRHRRHEPLGLEATREIVLQGVAS